MTMQDLITAKLAGETLSTLLLIVAIWWLNSGNQRLLKALESTTKAVLDEKDKRNEDLVERLNRCDAHILECERDRSELWKEIARLSTR